VPQGLGAGGGRVVVVPGVQGDGVEPPAAVGRRCEQAAYAQLGDAVRGPAGGHRPGHLVGGGEHPLRVLRGQRQWMQYGGAAQYVGGVGRVDVPDESTGHVPFGDGVEKRAPARVQPAVQLARLMTGPDRAGQQAEGEGMSVQRLGQCLVPADEHARVRGVERPEVHGCADSVVGAAAQGEDGVAERVGCGHRGDVAGGEPVGGDGVDDPQERFGGTEGDGAGVGEGPHGVVVRLPAHPEDTTGVGRLEAEGVLLGEGGLADAGHTADLHGARCGAAGDQGRGVGVQGGVHLPEFGEAAQEVEARFRRAQQPSSYGAFPDRHRTVEAGDMLAYVGRQGGEVVRRGVPGVAEFDGVDVVGGRLGIDHHDAAARIALPQPRQIGGRQLPLAGLAFGEADGVVGEQCLGAGQFTPDGVADAGEGRDPGLVREHVEPAVAQHLRERSDPLHVTAAVAEEDVPHDGLPYCGYRGGRS